MLLIPAAVKKLKEEGDREARRELNAKWDAWLRRRNEAHAKGLPFDEPSPSQRRNSRK